MGVAIALYMANSPPRRKRKPRNKHVKVLVNQEEKRRIEDDAAQADVSASEWLRTGRLPEPVK